MGQFPLMPQRLLSVFVYGTLKQGHANHKRYCGGLIDVRPAHVRGRLYLLPAGYPQLVVPKASILAYGSDDPLADVALQHEYSPPAAGKAQAGEDADQLTWEPISGELLVFDDPGVRLPVLDRLEVYRPGQSCMYLRVLLATEDEHDGLAWTYVAPGGNIARGARRIGNRWP